MRAIVAMGLVVGLAVPAGASDPGGSFIDDDGSVHESAIEAIRTAQVTEGCDPVGDRFCPGSTVTRAQMAVFLLRALEVSETLSVTPSFTDVDETDWYFGAVETMAASGVAAGYADGSFRPHASVTRGEMAVFLLRALKEDPVVGLTTFTDVSPEAFYAGAVERMLQLRITNGCSTDPLRYCPGGAVTRAEMASFLARAFGFPLLPVEPRPSLDGIQLALELVASGLQQPVFVDAPAGDPRLFVVEKQGRIRIVAGGVVRADPFLDVSAVVSTTGERGLLGMAFHPQYSLNGRFFVHYTDLSGSNRVVEYTVSDDPDAADQASARVLWTVPQPASNHNGGMIDFGPDGRLYVGIGDGGGAGDPYGNGQDPTTPLGAITAVDVDTGARSMFAYGLRNPWRFAWDGQRLYIGDVGQSVREEIDVISIHEVGSNLGWSQLEGSRCFVAGCSAAGTVLPVVEYTHNDGCSVTGGVVYRGPAIPALVGHYLYGDFCSGFVRSFRYTGVASDLRIWPTLHTESLVSFGNDGSGEILVVSIGGGVWRVTES